MMKRNIILGLFFAIVSVTNAQWQQIGQDIDGEAEGDYSGWSVSLSSDGTIVAIGAYQNDNGNGDNSGSVRIYENQNGVWQQIGQDIDGEAEGDYSGWSVSLSSDGTIVAIGAYRNDNGNGDNSGHVRIYENQNGTWVQVGSDIDGRIGDVHSGYSVSLSSDGTVVAIGVVDDSSDGGDWSGRVRIYENQDGVWQLIGQDIEGKAMFEHFGRSVSLNSDGTIVAIGASDEGDGVVRIYENQNGTWVQVGSDFKFSEVDNNLGRFVSLSSDGTIVAIGAPWNDENEVNSGRVRIYENQNGVWQQIGQDIEGEAEGDYSGWSVDLNNDGSIVAIGSVYNAENGNNSGHVRVYENQGGVWRQIGQNIDGEAAEDYSGVSVSLNSDGSTVAIGAPWNDGNGNVSGQVRVYSLLNLGVNSVENKSNINIFPNPTTGEIIIKSTNLEQIEIYNNNGVLIEVTDNGYIDLRNQSKGVYFVKVITKNNIITKKIIVE